MYTFIDPPDTTPLAGFGEQEPVHATALSKSQTASEKPGVVWPHGWPAYVRTPVVGTSGVSAVPGVQVNMAGSPHRYKQVPLHAVVFEHTASAVAVQTAAVASPQYEHAVQAEAPETAAYWPAAHAVQRAGEVDVVRVEYLPAGHDMQPAAPAVSVLYIPAPHAVHTAEVAAAVRLP